MKTSTFKKITDVSTESVKAAFEKHGANLKTMQADISALFWLCSHKHPQAEKLDATLRVETVRGVLAFCASQHGIAISKIDTFMRLAVTGKLAISNGKITVKKSGINKAQRSYAGIMERFQPTETQCGVLWSPPKTEKPEEEAKQFTLDEIAEFMLKTLDSKIESAGELTPAEVLVGINGKLSAKLAELAHDAKVKEAELETAPTE